MPSTIAQLEAAQDLSDLYTVFATHNYTAGWHKARPSLWRQPNSAFKPMHWRYREAAVALDRAGEWIGTELAERRNLLMYNPVGENDYATARTLVSAYQMIQPGEHARAHRHTPNALRLVLDSEPGLYTVVDGVKLPMNPGDVLLTPNWSWHSHYNEGKHRAYWIDFLDVPLVHLLEPMFYEEYPGGFQPVTSEPNQHPYWFSLEWVRGELAKSKPNAAGIRRLTLPSTQYMPTMALSYLQIPAGASTGTHSSTASRIFAVTSGHGTATIGNLKAKWERGDVFVAPSWTPYELHASEDAMVFEVTDEPALRALGFYRDLDPPPPT